MQNDPPLIRQSDVALIGHDPTARLGLEHGPAATEAATLSGVSPINIPPSSSENMGTGMSARQKYAAFRKATRSKYNKKGGYVRPANASAPPSGSGPLANVAGQLAGTAASYIPVVGPILGSVLKTAVPAIANLIAKHRAKKAAKKAAAAEAAALQGKGADPELTEFPADIDPDSIVVHLAGKSGREPADDLSLWRQVFKMAHEVLSARFGGTAKRESIIKSYIKALKRHTFGPLSAMLGDFGMKGQTVEKTKDGRPTIANVARPILHGIARKALEAAKNPEVQSAAKKALSWLAERGKEFLGMGILPTHSLHGIVGMLADEMSKEGNTHFAKKLGSLTKRLSGVAPLIGHKKMTPDELEELLALRGSAYREKIHEKAMSRLKKYLS